MASTKEDQEGTIPILFKERTRETVDLNEVVLEVVARPTPLACKAQMAMMAGSMPELLLRVIGSLWCNW